MAFPILMPKLGLTMETGIISAWLKKEGDPVQKGEALLEVETDKIVTEVQSPQGGILLKVLVPIGTEVKVQAVLAVVGEAGEDVSTYSAGPAAASAEAPDGSAVSSTASGETITARTAPEGRVRITPRARKLLEGAGFTVSDLEKLGKARIAEADVQDFLKTAGSSRSGQPAPAGGQVRPFGRIEKIVAARMTESFRDIPQFSLRFVAELGGLLDLLPAMNEEPGVRITINDLLLRATAIALSRNPEVQYQYRPDGIYVPDTIALGFAVASGRDLVVPVIHNVQAKRIGVISREAADLVERAKANRLRLEDVTGGTFTVSNLGMFGISSFVPIVNPGEGAILGVGAVQTAPRVRSGALTEARVIELTLVCDHRTVNGPTGAGFCRELRRVLESPLESSW